MLLDTIHGIIARRLFSSPILVLIFAWNASAASPSYDPDLSKWQLVSVPPEGDLVNRVVWDYAANYSNHEWSVVLENGRVKPVLNAHLQPNTSSPKRTLPFKATAGQFKKPYAVARVSDGYIVSFNQGEFGSALYWFSSRGSFKRKISDHSVIDFIALPAGLHATEGLDHMGLRRGSLIRIEPARKPTRWRATTVVTFSASPEAVTKTRDNSLVVVTAQALGIVMPDFSTTTLLTNAPWRGLYPNSIQLTSDESKAYIGMRQFVAEFTFATKELKLLIPDPSFLNKLPPDDELRLRKQYQPQNP